MARKVGDFVIALVILVFVITGFSALVLEADLRVGVSSGLVASDLSSLESSLGGVRSMEFDVAKKVYNSSDLEADPNVQVEESGRDTVGLISLLTGNILVKFFSSLKGSFPQAIPVLIFVGSLLGVTLIILGLRFFWGESKI